MGTEAISKAERWLLLTSPLLALGLVNASASIPYTLHDTTRFGLDTFEWIITAAFWVATVSLIGTAFLAQRWFAEVVFLDSWLFALAALQVALDAPSLDTNTRVAVTLLLAGVSSGVGGYWLRLRQYEREWTPGN